MTVFLVEAPAEGRGRRLGSVLAGLHEAEVVVLGDGNRVDASTRVRVDRVEVDGSCLRRRLSRAGQTALGSLVADPGDTAALRRFQAALRPVADRAGGGRVRTATMSGELALLDLDCDVVLADSSRVTMDHRLRLGKARLDLDRLLVDDAELCRELARSLAEGGPDCRVRRFERELARAVDADDVPSLVRSAVGTRVGRPPVAGAGRAPRVSAATTVNARRADFVPPASLLDGVAFDEHSVSGVPFRARRGHKSDLVGMYEPERGARAPDEAACGKRHISGPARGISF